MRAGSGAGHVALTSGHRRCVSTSALLSYGSGCSSPAVAACRSRVHSSLERKPWAMYTGGSACTCGIWQGATGVCRHARLWGWGWGWEVTLTGPLICTRPWKRRTAIQMPHYAAPALGQERSGRCKGRTAMPFPCHHSAVPANAAAGPLPLTPQPHLVAPLSALVARSWRALCARRKLAA